MAKKQKNDIFKPLAFYDFKAKKLNIIKYYNLIMARLFSMIEFNDEFKKDFPDSIIKKWLFNDGHFLLFEKDGKVHAFSYSEAANFDEWGRPRDCIVANPYDTTLSGTYTRGVNCMPIRLTYDETIYHDLISKYATIFSELDITTKKLITNARVLAFITAVDDRTMESAKVWLNNMENGEESIISDYDYDATGSAAAMVKAQPLAVSANNAIKQHIELMQYEKASCWNDLGINANFNMKREALNSSESALNLDALLPLTDHVINQLTSDLDEANKLFGTNYSVKLSSSWENIQEEADAMTETGQPQEPEKEPEQEEQ